MRPRWKAAMPRREVLMALPVPRPYGVVEKQPIGEISRRAFLGRMLGLYQEGEPAGFIMATIGAIVLLFIYRKLVVRT